MLGVDMSIDIAWRRNNEIINSSRITTTAVSGSGGQFTANVSYSPIAISDSSNVTALITLSPLLELEPKTEANDSIEVFVTGKDLCETGGSV